MGTDNFADIYVVKRFGGQASVRIVHDTTPNCWKELVSGVKILLSFSNREFG